MKNLCTLILLALTVTSCVTQRKCLQRFPPRSDTLLIVSTRDTIIYRDTIIFLEVVGARVWDSIIIPCPPPKSEFIPDTARAETTLAKALAWWDYPEIHLLLEQKDSIIILRAALKESRHWQEKYQEITKTLQPIKYVPDIYKIALWLWLGVIVAIGGYVIFRIWIKK